MTKNSAIKPLSTISVPCRKIQGGYGPPLPTPMHTTILSSFSGKKSGAAIILNIMKYHYTSILCNPTEPIFRFVSAISSLKPLMIKDSVGGITVQNLLQPLAPTDAHRVRSCMQCLTIELNHVDHDFFHI